MKKIILLIPLLLFTLGCSLNTTEVNTNSGQNQNINETVVLQNNNQNMNQEELTNDDSNDEELSDTFESIINSGVIEYKASPNGNYLAVQSTSEGGMRLIRIYNGNGEEVKIYASQDLGNTSVENTAKTIPNLINWSDDSRSLWGVNTLGATIDSFFKIDTIMWNPFIFNVQDYPIQVQEYYLNTNNDKVVYSDYPITFDGDSSDEFKDSGTDVHLFILNLMNNQQKEIATSKAKRFEPKWIDNDTVEYNDPENEERIENKVNN